MSEPTAKELAAAKKEGMKKGQDLSGLQDMGGISTFHVALEKCNGNWALVEEAMKGANTPVDPSGEERKGGAENIAKAFLSAGPDRLCIYLNVPDSLKEKVDIQGWFDVLVSSAGATVLEAPKDGFAKAETLKGDEIFPLKKRDEAIGMGFAYLRKNGFVPDESSSEEMGSFEEQYEW